MNKNISIELTRSFACMLVVLLHCAGSFTSKFDDAYNWFGATLIDSITRCSVPLFVLVTGALLGNSELDLLLFIRKRILRIIIPLVMWGIVYILFDHYFFNDVIGFEKTISMFISGPVVFHFWYLYMILGLYLFIPIINPWIKKAKTKDFIYFFVIWQIISFIYPIYQYRMGLIPGIELHYFSGFIGYYVLGYFIGSRKLFYEVKNIYLFSSAFIGILITYILIVYMSKGKETPILLFHNYLFPNVLITAISIFILFQKSNFSNLISKIAVSIGELSFGIYLFHILPLRIWFYYFPDPLISIAIIDILIPFLLIFISSWITIYLLSKFRFLKRVLF